MPQQLLELVRKKNIFRWNLRNLETKLIATILYYAGISFRKTSKFLADFESFSHESVRIWYHKMSRVFTTSKKYRRCIAIDEIKIKIWKQILVCLGSYRCGQLGDSWCYGY